MMKLGSETGNTVNHVMSASANPAPVVGMEATELGWTDRYGATVVKVSPSGKTIVVRRDEPIWPPFSGVGSGHNAPTRDHEPGAPGRTNTYRMTKKGWRSTGGNGLVLGVRESYRDPSF